MVRVALERIALFTILSFLLFNAFAWAEPSTSRVLVLEVEDTINPVTAKYLTEEIEGAQGNFDLIILELNTPGGGDKSMRKIIQEISLSQIPVVVYVYPPGSRAASAGTFIAYAAHFACMAPGTNIGAAHPVTIGEQPDNVSMEKITNDAVSFIVSLAEKNHRNKIWAEKAVRESASISAEEALKENVINFMARDLTELFNQLNGQKLNLNGKEIVLNLENPEIVTKEPGIWYRFLSVIADPNIAYILLVIGLYALIAEIYHPTVVAGVIGAICLIIAFFALETLTINIAGLLLMFVAMVLFILEIKTPGFGILGAGGIVAFVLGSLMLFTPYGFRPSISTGLSVWLVAGFTGLSAVFFFLVIAAAIRARTKPKVPMGLEALPGKTGVASSDLSPSGTVFVDGAYWRARVVSGSIRKGERIKVIGLEEMELIVEKEE
ncbi:MAG: nodulation protein NfeD [Coprothermobacterota bacterium]|nr:nodulation protein NfeD [Coprothermobacterota bacterium]